MKNSLFTEVFTIYVKFVSFYYFGAFDDYHIIFKLFSFKNFIALRYFAESNKIDSVSEK
jgi:hypothetical protein